MSLSRRFFFIAFLLTFVTKIFLLIFRLFFLAQNQWNLSLVLWTSIERLKWNNFAFHFASMPPQIEFNEREKSIQFHYFIRVWYFSFSISNQFNFVHSIFSICRSCVAVFVLVVVYNFRLFSQLHLMSNENVSYSMQKEICCYFNSIHRCVHNVFNVPSLRRYCNMSN